MCLAAPGRIVELVTDADVPGERLGTVDFNGSQVQVSLAMVPDAGVGAWVLVHAGYAITQLDEQEARETWDYLRQFEGVDGIEP